MKIGIMGSFGVGKSSITADIQSFDILNGYYCDLSSERTVANFCRHKNLSNLSKQHMLLYREAYNLMKYQDYITDNPVMLVDCYTNLIKNTEIKTAEEEKLTNWIEEGVELLYHHYDFVIYIPILFDIPIGRPKAESKELQIRVDNFIQQHWVSRIPDDQLLVLDTINYEERLKIILEWFERKLVS